MKVLKQFDVNCVLLTIVIALSKIFRTSNDAVLKSESHCLANSTEYLKYKIQ